MTQKLTDTAGAAEYVGLAPVTLEAWRPPVTGPKYVKLGRDVRYRLSDLDDYLSRQTRQHYKYNAGGTIKRTDYC